MSSATPRAAFTAEWIGDGGRAWVAKHALDPVAAIRLVKNAGGVTVFAHPGAARHVVASSTTTVVAAMAAAGLDGLEVDHPDHDAPTRTRLRRAGASSTGWLVTGSSDDHGTFTGDRLGCETTDPQQWHDLASQGGVMNFDGKLVGEVFATLLVIMDPLGTIPVFLGLTAGRTSKVRRRLAGQAVLVAFAVIALFAVLGRQILVYLGITVPALQAAGGLLLMLVALELLTGRGKEPDEVADVNVALVPLGTPLLAGPGAIVATIVFVRDAQHSAHPYANYFADRGRRDRWCTWCCSWCCASACTSSGWWARAASCCSPASSACCCRPSRCSWSPTPSGPSSPPVRRRHAAMGQNALMADLTDWFLTERERTNRSSAIRPWTEGNLVNAHVHGRSYFRRLCHDDR